MRRGPKRKSSLDEAVSMGPVITRQSRERIEGCLAQGAKEGATAHLDGRGTKVRGFENGNFLGPTILDGTPAQSELTHREVFCPVFSLTHAASMDDAIQIIARSRFGNSSSM